MNIVLDIKRIQAGHQEVRYGDRLWIAQTENRYSSGILQSKKWLLFAEDMSGYVDIFPSFKAITECLTKQLTKEAHEERLRKDVQRHPVSSFMGFATGWDNLPENIAKRSADYDRGWKVGMNAKRIILNRSLRWESDNLDGSYTTSYEKLGYHANTAYFYAGLVASGVQIDWYTDDGLVTVQSGIEQTIFITILVDRPVEETIEKIEVSVNKPMCKFCGQAHETRHCSYLV